MTAKKIERIVLISISAAVLVALILVPLCMYLSYNANLPPVDRVKTVRVEFGEMNAIPSGLDEKDMDALKDDLTVTAVYGSGRELLVDGSSYDITLPDGPTAIDRLNRIQVKLDVTYEAVGTLELPGAHRIEAEDETIVGGAAQTENGVAMAGQFHVTENAEDNYVEFDVYVSEAMSVDLTMRVANGNLKGAPGGSADAWMDPLPLAEIGRLTVNGEQRTIPSTAVIPGCGPVAGSQWASLYAIFHELTIEDFELAAGANTIRLALVDSGKEEYINAWNEPATINIDYFDVMPRGVKEDRTPERLALFGIEDEIEAGVGMPLSDVFFAEGANIATVYSDGTLRYVSESDLTISSSPQAERAQIGGDYTVTATLTGTDASAGVHVTAGNTVTADNAYAVEITGGRLTTENGRTFAGNFNTNNMPENSIEFMLDMPEAATVDLVISMSNGYLTKTPDDMYQMSELPLADIMDATLNGDTDIDLSGISLPETGESSNSGELYGNFVEITLKGIALDAGENTLVLSLHRSESGLQTCWGNSNADGDEGDDLPNESPVVNVEYVTVVTEDPETDV